VFILGKASHGCQKHNNNARPKQGRCCRIFEIKLADDAGGAGEDKAGDDDEDEGGVEQFVVDDKGFAFDERAVPEEGVAHDEYYQADRGDDR